MLLLLPGGGTGHPAPGTFGVLPSSGAGRSCSSMAARMASSSVRTTSGALVTLLFVVTVLAGIGVTVGWGRYTRASCRNRGPILPRAMTGAVRDSGPRAGALRVQNTYSAGLR